MYTITTFSRTEIVRSSTVNSGKSGLRLIRNSGKSGQIFSSLQQIGLSQCILLRQIRTPANPELRQIRTHLLVPSSKNHCFYSGKSGQQRMTCWLNENWFITRLLFLFNTFLLDHKHKQASKFHLKINCFNLNNDQDNFCDYFFSI